MKEYFVSHKFKPAAESIIEKANEILDDYSDQGLVLSLRQLYYQFVARGLLPNKASEYDRLGDIISNARLAGLIDWSQLEDRTRVLQSVSTWSTPESIIATVAEQYKEDLWRNQPMRPEVWVEKDALVGVVAGACTDLRVDYFACRGYASQSALYEAGMRFRGYIKADQEPIVFHLGDHDPSGIDMTRDNLERISMFAGQEIKLIRLALNMDQIRKYAPPPNPAKETDSRSGDYRAKYGDSSWELDALEPSVLDALLRTNIAKATDTRRWEETEAEEEAHRYQLEMVSEGWAKVKDTVFKATPPAEKEE